MSQSNKWITAVVLIVLFAILAGYFFFADQGATARIQQMNASSTALTAQIASLTSEDQNLATNLMLFVAPVGLTSPNAPMLISISGVVSAGSSKGTFVITTPYGVRASVANSADSGVAAALRQVVGGTAQIAGTFIPGTPDVTVTSVNGIPIR